MSSGAFQGTYDPEKVILSIGGISVSGFIDGDFITARHDTPRFFKTEGIDGETIRAMNLSKSGTIEVSVMASSKANDAMTTLLPASQGGTPLPPVPITIKDLSGRSLASCSKAWLRTEPDLVFGMEISDNKWIFDCADLDIYYGGSQSNSIVDFIVSLF
jgi:hypothetical protein